MREVGGWVVEGGGVSQVNFQEQQQVLFPFETSTVCVCVCFVCDDWGAITLRTLKKEHVKNGEVFFGGGRRGEREVFLGTTLKDVGGEGKTWQTARH